MKTDTISVTLVTQGKHKFFSGTMDISTIAEVCSTNPRENDPIAGFQRKLDESRANAIAEYIRSGGTIPSSIILSAQPSAGLIYSSKNRSISFNLESNSFLILDGQHRVFGFRKLMDEGIKYRIPIIIYNDLTLTEEAKIFIDINTLQKPVPKELLLDIKKLAQNETDDEILLNELFTYFEENNDSYLLNKLSRFDKQKGKLSKVTFYESMKPIIKEFEISNTEKLYKIINSFLFSANDIAKENNFDLESSISKPTFFKILAAHSRAVIALISDNNPGNIEKISEHKKYLSRSLPGSFSEIQESKAYLKTVDMLDKKLIRRNISI